MRAKGIKKEKSDLIVLVQTPAQISSRIICTTYCPAVVWTVLGQIDKSSQTARPDKIDFIAPHIARVKGPSFFARYLFVIQQMKPIFLRGKACVRVRVREREQ